MLIQFVVENYLSFRDKQILSMRAPEAGGGVTPRRSEGQTVRTGGEELLRCAAIYGANASGKSNLVRALEFVQDLIIEGTPSKRKIARRPFKLDPACNASPSRFEIAFIHDDVVYAYGFAVDSERVYAEWLFRGQEDDETLLFRRELNSVTGGYSFEAGEALASAPARRQFYEFLHEGTRPNQLFLSEAEERNAPELAPPLTWFRDRLRIIYPDADYPELAALTDEAPAFRKLLQELLARADTGITTVATRHISLAKAKLPEGAKAGLLALLQDENPMTLPSGRTILTNEQGELEIIELTTRHGGAQNEIKFKLDEESDGTRRLMHLAPVLHSLDDETQVPGVFVIDELDRSLHPLLTRFFLQEFLRMGNTSAANQLVCTTHDTNLLDVDLLPPSSIWFVEKDRAGASHLYSLDEFDEDQLAALHHQTEEGYLAGRFGAIPFLGNPEKLVSREQSEGGEPEGEDED